MNRRDFTKLCLTGLAATALPAEESHPTKKRDVEIYLTVDDGWNQKKTIIDIANHYKVPLNLFIIGQVIDKDKKIWQQALEQGHMLGSHTYNHHKLSRIDESTIVEDFKQYKRCIIRSIGEESFSKIKFFRYPYGDVGIRQTKTVTKKLIEDHGWRTSWWSADLSFSSTKYGAKAFKDSSEQLHFFAKNIKNVNVPLFHFKDPDAKAIELVIKYGLEKGYKFLRLDSSKSFLKA